MTFEEMVAEVILLTRRPDLQDRTRQAVRAATLKAHHSDFYYPDIVESSIQFGEAKFIQNFQPTEINPLYRKVKYIRHWHDSNWGEGLPGEFLEHIQIENAMDGYGHIKTNVFYLAGQLMQIRTTSPLTKCLFGYYVHPSIVESNYSSWIARDCPYAIIYGACRTLFKGIGLDAEAREYDGLTAEQYLTLRMTYVDDTPFT